MAEPGFDNYAFGASRCRVCDAALSDAFRSELSVSVSSACAPVPCVAHVVRCSQCGLFQKTDADMVADYHHYEQFDNDPSADKIIRKAGQPDRTRAQFVSDLLLKTLEPGDQRRILEVGCHRGAFLTALKAKAPGFELHGFDLDPDYALWIEPICGAGRYHHGDLAALTGPYDACVLVHTLEHIPRPLEILQTIRKLLASTGVLVIVVPDALANPVDFYTIDHASHFTATHLQDTLARAGFVAVIDTEMIPNELVALARPGMVVPVSLRSPSSLVDRMGVLRRFERGVNNLPAAPCHVFGTALIGGLLAGVLGDRCVGFVDEAPFRVGKTFLGRPVRAPGELKNEAVVLGVAERLATHLAFRLRTAGLTVINPWEEDPQESSNIRNASDRSSA